nr:restriction endonuclease subunit S [uncultured Agathobacter sp.]
MNKIDELIREYYPDGVEIRYLEDCCNLLDKKRKPITKASREAGEYPYYGANGIQDYVANYIFDGTYVLVGEDGSVITKEGTPVVTWAKGKIWVNNHAHIIEEKEGVMLRYLYHYLQTIDVTSLIHGNIPKLTGGDFKALKIAVPPLEVQREIVRILDCFTLLTTELTTELTAELTARKKQYEYYHNALMDFTDRDVQYKSVGELFEIKNGLNKEKDAFGKGQPIINFTDVYNKRWLAKGSFKGLVDVTEEEIKRYSAKKGDVFFTRTSETKEDIGMSSTLIGDIPNCVFSGFVLRARPITDLLLPKFCSYYFSTNKVRDTIVRYAAFTTRATTTGPKLSKIMVPILSIEEQQRIVDILDRFDSLCNSISEGLPAEIDARTKQYEFYRDKLLTFKKDGENA